MEQKPLVTLPAPSHMGIVVKSVDDAVLYYQKFGWGPFQARILDTGKYPGFMFRGQPAKTRFKVAIGHSGTMLVELFQPLEGESPYAEFARAKGEGLHHLGFLVPDFEAAWAALTAGGFEPVFHGKNPGRSFAYFATDKAGGVMFEVLDFAPG